MGVFDNCSCDDLVLPTVPVSTCSPTKLPKIQKVFFQVVDSGNDFVDAVNGIELAASWSALPDATDETKVVISPNCRDVTIGESSIVDGPENYDGATVAYGSTPGTVVLTFDNINPTQSAALDELFCTDKLAVAFITSNDRIMCRTVDATPTYSFMPISEGTYITMSPARDGSTFAAFEYKVQFKMPTDWYSKLAVIVPETGFSYLSIAPS